MARMTIRSTYALDEQTTQRIRYLAQAWNVSQAEVIRRSVRQAFEQQAGSTPSPTEVVARYVKGPLPRSKAESQSVIAEMRALRHEDDERRTPASGA